MIGDEIIVHIFFQYEKKCFLEYIQSNILSKHSFLMPFAKLGFECDSCPNIQEVT